MPHDIDLKIDAISSSNKRLLEIESEQDLIDISLIGKALSAPIRIQILRLINKKPRLLTNIADELNLQFSSAAFHLKVLEEAGLITVERSTKGNSTSKIYACTPCKVITLLTREIAGHSAPPVPAVINIPIGDFVNAELGPLSGYASDTELLIENAPLDIFSEVRHKAQILWNSGAGFVEYAIPNGYVQFEQLKEVSFSFEICSEAQGYNEDFPSDITFYINGIELYTWTCHGDYGDKYGLFTPSWWLSESTKYGLLSNIKVNSYGVSFNEKLVNRNVRLKDLNLSDGNRTTFRIEVKKNAKHCGGFNLFGEKFGNYNQSIVFMATYK